MAARNTPLEAQVLAAFERALATGRLDVAEHLLRALEVLQPDCVPGTSVADAYRSVAGMPPRGREDRPPSGGRFTCGRTPGRTRKLPR